MAKIAVLLPREEMVAPARELVEELRLDVPILRAIHTSEAAKAGEEAVRIGAEFIVARGIQARILRDCTHLPTVDIHLTGQEIAVLIKQALHIISKAHPTIAIIGFENMLSAFGLFENVFDVTLRPYFVLEPDDLVPAARRAIDEGADVIIAGDAVNAYCESRAFPSVFLNSTADSLRSALIHTRDMAEVSEREKQNTAHQQALLDYSFNGIIELDEENRITAANNVACSMLKASAAKLRGRTLFSLMTASDAEILKNAIDENAELYSNVITLSGVTVVANIAPVKVNGEITARVFSFYEMQKIVRMDENAMREKYLRRHVAAGNFELITHKSKVMLAAVKQARAFAQSSAPVLILGELGTEKEIFAQSMHNTGSISKGPFVSFACDSAEGGALLVNGINDNRHAEYYLNQTLSIIAKQADSGTLYLRNIDKLGLTAQQTLVRIIEDKIVYLPNDQYPVRCSVRIVASSRVDLLPLVERGQFRRDLYYQLIPLSLTVPPVRERGEDKAPLLQAIIDECCKRNRRYIVLTADARRKLLEYPWPGNRMQMQYFIERMLITTPSRTVIDSYILRLLDELYPPQPIMQTADTRVIYKDPEAVRLTQLLDKHKGSRTEVAEELNISKTTLWRKMKKLGIYNKYDT